MTEPDVPSDGKLIPDLADTLTKSKHSVTHTRRGLLQTLTMGGSLVLAGCGQDTSTTPTVSQGAINQTLRIPTDQNPTKATVFLPSKIDHLLRSTFATVIKQNASLPLLRERGVWSDGVWVGADVYYNWIEKPIEFSPNEVKITIRDDARWSDGHRITGKDLALEALYQHIKNQFPPPYANDGGQDPETIWLAYDEFDISEQSVRFRSSQGYFDDFWDWTIRTKFGWPDIVPTHIEPYDAFADAVIETTRKAQQGGINPWKGYDSPVKTPNDPHTESLVKKYLGKRKYVETFSKPDNVLATGAWDLVEFRGSEAFVFKKNPHHRNADKINFETVILEYNQSAKRERAALKAERLDYGTPGPTPQSVVDSLPDSITQLLIPGLGGTGNELGLNFDHPALGNRRVRAAMMYALDQSVIATNVHQSAAVPVDRPGGDCWDATDFASQAWIDKNLIKYATNRDEAARLMREAGYTKRGGQWIGTAGEPITLTLATPSGTPRWEPTVASQLSEFGIETSVKTLDGTTFAERTENGEFPLWAGTGFATNIAAITLYIWYAAIQSPDKYNIYSSDQIKDFDPLPRTEEHYKALTVQAPPIGNPNAGLKEYHPAALFTMFLTNPPEDEYQRRVKTNLWLTNWFLPTIPINKTLEQHFIDDTHWLWPRETPSWKTFTEGRSGSRNLKKILASGKIQANSDNPEKGTPANRP